MSKKNFKTQTFSVYVSTTLVLMLFGVMCLLMIAADSLSNHVKRNMTVSLIIDGDSEEEDILKLQKSLDKKEYILSTEYISKEQVLKEQTVELGTNPVEFLGYNPYEASIELSMKPEYADNDNIAKIEKELAGHKDVKEVVYHKELISTINSNIQKISLALSVFLVLLMFISWSLIGNMVRLSIYSKRFLLHTMKLVGATWGFIRRPFLMRNLRIGLLSGVFANILLGTIIYFVAQKEPGIYTVLPIGKAIAVAGIVILFGVGITVLCAFLSVNRFLRMRGNDLYFI